MSDKVEISDSEKKKEDWMNSKWRPMMGWMYMVVCTMDMVIFPILWSLLQTLTHSPITQWNPLTLQGAGLFHIAMGAVLGLAAWGRTQEKMAGANNGGLSSSTNGPAAFGSASAAPSSFGAPSTPSSFGGGGFGGASSAATSGGFGSSSGVGATASPAMSSTGKPMPVQPSQPEI